MADNLEKALGKASISNLVSNMLHPLLITRQKVREVNNGSALGRRHFDLLKLKRRFCMFLLPMRLIGELVEKRMADGEVKSRDFILFAIQPISVSAYNFVNQFMLLPSETFPLTRFSFLVDVTKLRFSKLVVRSSNLETQA